MTLHCEHCGDEFASKRPSHRFCSDKCRANHHKHHMPAGTVSGVRRLTSGKISVTIHFDDSVALSFKIKDRVTVGNES